MSLPAVSLDCTAARRPRLLITGGTGWLAQHLYQALSAARATEDPEMMRMDVHVTSRSSSVRPWWVPADRFHEMDLAGEGAAESIDAVISTVLPDVIVHSAAVSIVVKCESNDEAAAANNPEALVAAVNRHVPDAVVVFTSTTLVYAGREQPYEALDPFDEEMTRNPPRCEYGKSKLGFERLLASSVKKYVVLRLSNSLGGAAPFAAAGVNFLEFLEGVALKRQQLDLKNDEFRSYLDVGDVVKLIQRVIESPDCSVLRAVYNVGGPRGMSRLDLAIALAAAREIPIEVYDVQERILFSTVGACSGEPWVVHSVSSEELLQRNPGTNATLTVPHLIVMDSSSTEIAFGFFFKSIEDMLKTYR